MTTIPNQPLFFVEPNPGFDRIKGIRYFSKARTAPQASQKISHAKIVRNVVVTFPGCQSKETVHAPYTKKFAKTLKFALPVATKSVRMEGPAFFNFRALKLLIRRNARIRCFALPVRNSQEKVIDYLKEIRHLTITHGLDPAGISHEHIDPLRLSKLYKLETFHLNLDHIYNGMYTNHLSYLTRAIGAPYFKAKVGISSSVFRESKMCSILNSKGASHIHSLQFGELDAGSFDFLVKEAGIFKNLNELAFTIKISNKLCEHYGESFLKLQEL
mmetsp:Transcript_1360/g.1235  ORF Transcript_1360/g.1235 Transcript_1360/m.1235 type:complete len:272 (+) Transcript_1360:86-901(+)|eukprot:CAMPEP_0114586706 /NCGR_PEP_ID=MMETSP0125-20121206/9853_1 /TAXON_ID=485358 ORGANISM="Aristerostoma sp., Strain ATCC 50986" /NCGR_SAMPLE_ID=MMETSP0125 /ASSEMBLY_ACC=CAM_ASM_000245 /LENGTH=271 /DNA_ID=CAMNT_0001782259 /DNA_START=64 /DNA_END=879 /DNA_ORIENTATION=+